MSELKENHAVVGAGLIGGLWALMLAQRGNKVVLYDRRPDPRKGKHDGGRSINLALATEVGRLWKKLGLMMC